MLRPGPANADKRQRLHNEFNIYLDLEKAYQSRQPHDRIAPRCYGAFEGNDMAVLILDSCDGVLNDWGELSDSEAVSSSNHAEAIAFIDDHNFLQISIV